MLRNYILYFILHVVANALWAFWALPEIHEEGSLFITLRWMLMQILLPLLFGVLLARRRRYVYGLLAAYGVVMLLFGFGTAGWALMGVATPLSVYLVCGIFFIIGFGVLARAMKDLGVGNKIVRHSFDERE